MAHSSKTKTKNSPEKPRHKRAKHGGSAQHRHTTTTSTTLAAPPASRLFHLPYELCTLILQHLIASTQDLHDVRNLLLAATGSGVVTMVSVFRACGKPMLERRIADEEARWVEDETDGLFAEEGVMGCWTRWLVEVFPEPGRVFRWKNGLLQVEGWGGTEGKGKGKGEETGEELVRFIEVIKSVRIGLDDEEE